MKKKQKLSLLPSLGMAAVALIGCGLSSGGDDAADFTIWCYQVDTTIENYGNSPVFKEIEKRTGKHVKFILGEDQSSLLATKSYPEVCLWLGYPNGYETGIRNGVVKDITDYVKNDMPNYKKVITSKDDIWRATSCGNNRIGGLFTVNNTPEPPWRGLVMRKDAIEKYKDRFTTYCDWEDLGEKDSQGKPLLTPTLYSHWTDIFTVVKQAYKDSNGKEGFRYPCSISSKGFDGFDTLSAGFDIALGDTSYYDCNGTLKTGYVEPGFKDYLTQINAWYKAGFINPNFAQTANGLTTDNVDTVGTARNKPYAICWPELSTYMDLRVDLAKNNGIEDYALMAVPQPRQSESQINHLVNTNGYVGLSACITTKCSDEKTKEICEWFDHFYSEEFFDLINYGIEGVTYTLDANGNKIYNEKMRENPDKGYYEQIMYNFPGYYDVNRRDWALSEEVKRASNEIWKYKNDGAYNLKNTAVFSGDDGTEYASIMNAVTTNVQENTIKFIKGTRSVSKDFGSFVHELKTKYNIDRATELREQSYRDYLKLSVPEDWK